MVELSREWVEVGAGTGYWAAQLLRAGAAAVVAMDVHPPDKVGRGMGDGTLGMWDGRLGTGDRCQLLRLQVLLLLV